MADKGQLFYLVGGSGCGKDSLIAYARRRLNDKNKVLFAHRYITRPPIGKGENHVALSHEEFRLRLKKKLFVMHWQAHGLLYGVGIEIDHWLSNGCHVVVNGSRSYLPNAAERYPNLSVILVQVAPHKLKQRLAARSRETAEQIEKRLQRNRKLNEALLHHIPDPIIVDNNGPLEIAGEMLVKQLVSCDDPKR